MGMQRLVRGTAVRIAVSTTALLLATAGRGFAADGDPQAPQVPQASAAAAVGGAQAQKLLDNLSLFVGLDGSKQPQDLGINANMGVRFAANMGFPLVDRANLGAQVGAAVNLSDAAVHVLDQISTTSRRSQTYLTVGLFQRPVDRMNWSLAYDALFQSYYDKATLGQVRGQVGFDVTRSNEVGVWFTKGAQGDNGTLGTTAIRLDPISQVNGYTTIRWASRAKTTVWLGMANGHGNVVWVFPDNSRDGKVFVYGAELSMPLNDRFAVTGAANFLTPTATGTVDAYLGVSFFPGRKSAGQSRFAPPTMVANSPTFPVNLSR